MPISRSITPQVRERCIASFPNTRSRIGVSTCPCVRPGRAERQQGFHSGRTTLRHRCQPRTSPGGEGEAAPAWRPAGQCSGRAGDRCRAFSHAGGEPARCAGPAGGFAARCVGKAESAHCDASDARIEGAPHCGKTHTLNLETRAWPGLRYGVIRKDPERTPFEVGTKTGSGVRQPDFFATRRPRAISST